MYKSALGGLMTLVFVTTAPATMLEIPTPGMVHSGIGVISGWKCEAEDLTVRFDGGPPLPLLHGSSRTDVRAAGACPHDQVGFVSIMNWSELGDGEHTAVVYDDGVEFDRATFTVVTTGVGFLRGVTGSGTATLSNGQQATLQWSEATQSFVATDFTAPPIETPDEVVLPEGCEEWITESVFRKTPEWVQDCLDAGVDPNVRDESGSTLLSRAVSYRNITLAKLLLDAGADPNVQNREGETPLHSAASRDDITLIELLLDAGADPNVQGDREGRTPLHWALRHRNSDIAKLLLDAGADPNVQDRYGFTPLHFADDTTLAKLLLDAGADPNVQDNNGYAPLHSADDTTLAKLLLDAGADPNVQDNGGNTPLHSAARADNATLVKLLLDAGADPTIRNTTSWETPDCAHLDARCR